MKIGLTMSGGGYRASAYSLGTLSYLHSLEFKQNTLLKHVKAISTVSGGSITGLSYAQSVKKSEDFKAYFQRLFTFLTKEDLVNEGITNFVSPGFKNSLIEGFSVVYTEKLFNHATFESILPEKNDTGGYDTHLDFTCINATEFNTGTPFRFIAQLPDMRHRIGNHYYKLDRDLIKPMPLGIPLAASSCFPGGFEPISIDMGQYISSTSVIHKNDRNKIVNLMDGGIVDNQGIDSILLYDTSKKEKEDLLNLIIVADVASSNIAAYEPTKEKRIPIIGNLKMIAIYRFTWIMNLILGALLFVPFIQQSRIALIAVSGLLMLFTLATFILTYAKRFIRKAANTNEVGIGKINKMNVLTPNAVAELFINRVNSVTLMVGSVFLKHLRSKHYDELFGNRNYVHKCFSTAIYDLKYTESTDKQANIRGVSFYDLGVSEPTTQIRDICTAASGMKTTLWVPLNKKGKEKIRGVITAGQLTTCINFIIYYHKIKKSYQSIQDRKAGTPSQNDAYHESFLSGQIKQLEAIDQQAREHWNKFIENPWWMVDELNEK